MKDVLKLTSQEAESMGIELEREETAVPTEVRELPMHEQVVGELTEGEVVEALTGEVTPESREDVEEAIGDLQEDVAEEEGT
jgi:predicted amino acid racemase